MGCLTIEDFQPDPEIFGIKHSEILLERLNQPQYLDVKFNVFNANAIENAIFPYLRETFEETGAIAIFTDVNSLKALNAVLTHPGADKVLLQIAAILNGYPGLTARFGGDEFVTFIPKDIKGFFNDAIKISTLSTSIGTLTDEDIKRLEDLISNPQKLARNIASKIENMERENNLIGNMLFHLDVLGSSMGLLDIPHFKERYGDIKAIIDESSKKESDAKVAKIAETYRRRSITERIILEVLKDKLNFEVKRALYFLDENKLPKPSQLLRKIEALFKLEVELKDALKEGMEIALALKSTNTGTDEEVNGKRKEIEVAFKKRIKEKPYVFSSRTGLADFINKSIALLTSYDDIRPWHERDTIVEEINVYITNHIWGHYRGIKLSDQHETLITDIITAIWEEIIKRIEAEKPLTNSFFTISTVQSYTEFKNGCKSEERRAKNSRRKPSSGK